MPDRLQGRYRVEAPAGVAFDLEARPGPWTRLDPVRRRLAVGPDAEIVEDFVLGGSAGASGRLEGPVGQERLTLFAIRVEDYPRSPGGWASLATILDRNGHVHDWTEGRDGRLAYRDRHPEQFPPDPPPLDVEALQRRLKEHLAAAAPPPDLSSLAGEPLPPWKLVVEADGYLAATAPASGIQRLLLQRARDPNVILLVDDGEGAPFDGRIEGTFESAESPAGAADARVEKERPGRFRAVLPPGTWRLRLGASVHVVVDVPATGTVTIQAPRLP